MTNPAHHQQQQEQEPAKTSCKAMGRKPSKLFDLGQLVATPAALMRLEAANTDWLVLVSRHVCGDFGNLSDDDREANREAVQTGARVMSVYDTEQGPIWVITEHDRSATTVLLPSDY